MNEQDGYFADAELITIVEGPPPQFQPPREMWALSVHEKLQPSTIAYCQMRTFNGPKMLERCQNAWAEERPVMLDFPDQMGMRQQVEIIAARWNETDEGHILHLWVRRPFQSQQEDNDHDPSTF
jgi:hypothetical protein